MSEFRIPHSTKLQGRLIVSPPKIRIKHLRRIDRLLQELSDDRDYPFDYIRYRVIGYCIDQDTGESFRVEDLRADLATLAREIRPLPEAAKLEKASAESAAVSLTTTDIEPEPAYFAEDLFEDPSSDAAILREGGDAARNSKDRLFTHAEETGIFRCYNYCKYKVTQLTRMIADSLDRYAVVERINFYKGIALECRNRIIEANLRLVPRVARQHLGKNLTYEELISDGNNSLMLAVEKFDYCRGTRFSTYGTWAIVKNYASSVPRENLIRKTFRTDSGDLFENVEQNEKKYKTRLLPRLWRTIEEAIDKLPEKERIAVTHFFGVKGTPISLRRIAPKLGIRSKEIARRYKDRGLRRLQEVLDADLYEQIYT